MTLYINTIIFLIFISSFFLLLTLNPVQALLWLVLIFCCYSTLLIILGIEFLAFLIFIVYVGAIIILFLFVVMMLNIRSVELFTDTVSYLPVSLFIFFIFCLNIFLFFFNNFSFQESNSLITFTSVLIPA